MTWKRPRLEERMLPLLQGLPTFLAGNILDIGTGDGVFASILAKKYMVSHIMQMDLRRFSRNHDTGYLGDMTSLPHRSFSLDLIMVAQVLHFIPKHQHPRIVSHLTNLLTSQGTLVIIEYDTSKPTPWIPYPLDPNIIYSPLFNITKVLRDKDTKRPKTALYIQRK